MHNIENKCKNFTYECIFIYFAKSSLQKSASILASWPRILKSELDFIIGKKRATLSCHSECLHNGIILIVYILQICCCKGTTKNANAQIF